ncbi:alpha/beta hydrolase [Anaerorhabdus sp.]|uniref:alpha/beta hydrolase n=1 Tax=Anaerorhabdus sp. TaxID=1872524 RepID=UPI002FC5B2BB
MAEKSGSKVGKVLAVTAGVTLAVGATYCATCAYIFTKVFKRKKNPSYLEFSNSLITKKDNDLWFDNVEKSNVEIVSYDGYKLSGTLIQQPTDNYVIVFHAYDFFGTQVLDVPKRFYDEGYNCLVVDQRAYGASEGDYTTLGWKEHYDCVDWIDFIIKQNPNAKIVLHGTSLGGATVLNATGEFLPSNVVCAISDCAFTSIEDLLKYQIKRFIKVPFGALVPGVNLLCKSKMNFNLYEANTLRQVKQSSTPTLFLHGELDSFVPFEMVFDLFYACTAEKELCTFQESKHAESFLDSKYFDKIFEFVNTHLNKE